MKKIKSFFSSEDLFAKHNGLELMEVSTGYAKVIMQVQPYHFNGAKTVHGGAIFSLGDFAFAVASNSHGSVAMGINVNISFHKAATTGTLKAIAQEKTKSHKIGAYDVDIYDDLDDLVASFHGLVYRKNQTYDLG